MIRFLINNSVTLIGSLLATIFVILSPKDQAVEVVPVDTTAIVTTVETTVEETTAPIIEETIEAEIETEPVEVETYLGEFKITAYCACSKCCDEWADGITYTGTVATENRTIAVDPKVIPLGSIVEINGNKYVAEDIGGAIKKNRIDVFFNSHYDALVWGVQYRDVYVVE